MSRNDLMSLTEDCAKITASLHHGRLSRRGEAVLNS